MGQQDYDKILFEAVVNENYKEAAFLLGVGANPNRLLEEHDGVSPFHMAVGLENDNLRFTQLFLKSNANVNIKSDKNWWTPLHVCASWNKPDSMHLLLLNQANPFLQDKNGKTPLDIAVENQSWPCVKILREFIEAKKLKPPHQDKLLSTMTTATATATATATTSQRAVQSMTADHQNMTEDASSSGSDYTYVEVGGPSNCLPILSLMENDDKSYSNAKTSTFNDSNFDFYLSSQSTTNRGKQPLQQQHESRRAAASHSNSASSQQHASINESKRTLSNSASTSVVNNVNELESLISNLIDIKLKEKTSGLNLVSNKIDQRGSSREKPTAASSSASSSIRSSRGGVPLPKGAVAAATSASSSSRRAMASNSASNLDAGKESSIKRDHRTTTNSRSQATATMANKSVRSSSNASRSRAATSSGIPLASSSSHTAANTKSTSASTQTRITGKRFYSPEKLPAFHTDSATSKTNVGNANVAASSSNSNIARQPVPSVVAPLPPPAQSRSNSVASTNRSRTVTAPPTMASPSSHKLVDSKTTQTQGRMVKLSDVAAVSSSLSTPPPPPPPPPLPSAPLMSPSPMPPSTRAITDQMLAELNVRIRRNETLNGGTGNNNSNGNGCRALATTTTTTTTTTTALSSPFSRAVPEHERTTPIVNRPPPTPHQQTSSHHVTESQHNEQQHEEEDNEATAASGNGGFNSRFKNWISKISAPFVTSGSASATNIDGQQQQNEIRFKSSSSVTRLDRSADGSTKQQTASLEQNARFKSNSSTSIFKHEEKLKQKQTVKNDQQKATRKQEVKRRSSSLMSSKKSTSPQSSSQLEQNQLTSPPPQIYSNPNVIEKKLQQQQQQHTPRMNTHELNNINGMLLRDEIGVQFFHNVLGSSEMINNKFTPVRIIKRSDSVEYEGLINRGNAPPLNNPNRRVVDGPIQPMTSGFIREQPVTSRNLMQSPPSPIDDLMTDDYENFDDELTLDEKNGSCDSSSSVLSDLNRAGLIYEDEDEEDATSCRTLETYRTASDNVNGEYMAMIEDDLRELKLANRKDEKESETTVIQKPLRKEKPNNKKAPFLEAENVTGYYSQELSEELDNGLEMTTCSDVIERNMFTCFQSPGTTEWREGNIKSAFNYLLIDPRLTENLPVRAKQERMSERDVLRTFIEAVFYVGKGSRARPYAHLYDACRYWKGLVGRGVQAHLAANAQTKPPKRSKKIDRILSIWEEDKGVVSLHCFQSVIPSEAYTREAAMIDAIGMEHLTNMKKGNYYGEAKEWTTKAKRQLGVVLLKRACAIFMAEGERQIMPRDL